jgi:hypothetical protein
MKVLFLHANQPDYLAESLFHGLRVVLGGDCVDVPRYDSVYKPLTDGLRGKLRGNGFTLYGLLDELPELREERFFWRKGIQQYDLVVIADVWRKWRTALEVVEALGPHRVVLMDGSDFPAWFPFSTKLIGRLSAHQLYASGAKYFKRELCGSGRHFGFLTKKIPAHLRGWMRLPRNARQIAFSIPAEKISKDRPLYKTKDFANEVVDAEVAEALRKHSSEVGRSNYLFHWEHEYYADLQSSRFGITTKRAGWDCLRHYEIAANGCVPCFRDLDTKPATCAPHGLDRSNCLIYRDWSDLTKQIAGLDEPAYARLRASTLAWIERNTTAARASGFLRQCAKDD